MLITAASYPFLNVLWDILIIFAWVLFIWIAIVVFSDLFQRRDISGWGKAAWVVLIVLLPWIGVLAYLIVNHDGMAERTQKQTQVAQAQFDQYVRQAAGKGGPASEIETAKKLLDSGAITQTEFDAIKAKALGGHAVDEMPSGNKPIEGVGTSTAG
jgi:predicted PurR-regulated permease PerM